MTANAMARRGPTAWEIALLCEVLLVAVGLGLWWYNFSVNSPDALVRARALGQVKDLAVLRRMASTDAAALVRKAAVERLEDPAALSAVATSDDVADVRAAAVKRLSEPALLARIAISDKDIGVRRTAVQKLTDHQPALASIATSDSPEQVRVVAVQSLTDQAALLHVATTDKATDLRTIARTKLTPEALARAAQEAGDPQLRAMLLTAAQLLRAAEAIPRRHRDRILAQLLVLPQHYVEPLWVSRFGALESMTIAWGDISQEYNKSHVMTGERITFSAKFARQAAPLSAQWRSQFPRQVAGWQTWSPATIQASDAVFPWLAADQAALAKIAAKDGSAAVRRAAVANLADRKLAARIAESDPDESVRNAARQGPEKGAELQR